MKSVLKFNEGLHIYFNWRVGFLLSCDCFTAAIQSKVVILLLLVHCLLVLP